MVGRIDERLLGKDQTLLGDLQLTDTKSANELPSDACFP